MLSQVVQAIVALRTSTLVVSNLKYGSDFLVAQYFHIFIGRLQRNRRNSMRKTIVVSISMLLLVVFMVGIAQADPPPVSGVVTRGEIDYGVTWVDENKGLRILIGLDVRDYCNGSDDFAIVSFQDIDLTDERFVEIVKGDDHPADVYPFLEFDCDRFLSEDPVGLGTVDYVGTDNDTPGTSPDETNANAWGWSAHGTLTAPDGTSLNVSGHLRLVFSNNGGFHVNERINVK
jgi:hypothetical protein